MGLPMNLLKEFAKQVSSGEKKEQSTTYYGEVLSKTENEVTVQLDGSDVSTPADCTMDAEVGDRVMVQIKDHKAVVVGNATSPASARTASAFMRLMDDGLVIGKIDDSEVPVYLFLSDAYYIKRQLGESISPNDDETLATFTSTIDLLGAIIEGFIVQKPNPTDPSEILNVPGIQISADIIRLVATWSRYPVQVELDTGFEVGCFGEIRFNSDQGNPLSNGVELVNRNDIFPIFKTGSVSASGTIAANSYGTITSAAISVPSGYSLLGIRSITTNHSNVCHMTQFQTNMTAKTVSATFHNDSSSNQDTTVTFYYFCIRSS